jgi:hypothetical protein
MADTFRNGKVHVLRTKCNQCAFTPERIVPGARVAGIVADTKDEPGAHFICHKTTIAGDGDAICRGWYDKLGDIDPIIQLAQRMGIIEEIDA